MTTNKRQKQRITLSLTSSGTHSTGHMGGTIDVKGGGQENYPFPSGQDLAKRALEKATPIGKNKPRNRRARRVAKAEGTGGGGSDSSEKTGGLLGINPKLPNVKDPMNIIHRLPDEPEDKLAQTLKRAADGMASIMSKRQLDGLIDGRFGKLVGAVTWAKANMEAKYQDCIGSLESQLNTLQQRYREAIPLIVTELTTRNPKASKGEIFKAAIQLLDQELAQILTVLSIYTDSFGQYRDGVYAQELRIINFFFMQAFRLNTSVDPDKATGTPQLHTANFSVKDVFLARFTAMGLATIPGTRGPLRAHALQVPFDMRYILALMLPLMAHEFRHNVFHDVKGLEEQLIKALKDALEKAHADGTLKLSAKTYQLSRRLQVPAIDLLVKLMVDSIGEIDADISGGVLFSGPSYLYNMLLSFPAMLGGKLRTSSHYQLVDQENGDKALTFEPHPPDYIRTHIVAAGLDEIGFSAEANECRSLADKAVGEVPKDITWSDGDEKNEMVIRIPVADIVAVAPVVAKALIRTPLEALNGKTTADVINWTPAREAKVRKLADILKAGRFEIPSDGSYFATYVGSAATLAYWELVHEGKEAEATALSVNENAMKMLEAIRATAEAQKAA